MQRAFRWALAGFGSVPLLLLLLVAAGYGFLRGGAPRLDGEFKLDGLTANVSVVRDRLGVPSITGANHPDVARALGFLHAQDRFFQMDLLRRLAAGELAELFGPVAVDFDKQHRLFRLRATAAQVLARATPDERAVLEAYSAGVNAGLRALTTEPFEYGLLFKRPRAWQPEDSVLVVYAMYFDLQDPRDRHESNLAVARDTLPPPLFRFLTAPGTQWDAPIVGVPVETPPIPGPDVMDLRKQPSPPTVAWHAESAAGEIGSNNWAVSAAHSADGHALLANDMHLGLQVPNIWYRAQYNYVDGTGRAVTVTGVTLPGVPNMVVGSNRHVAWGFTNSYGDWVDLVLLHLNPADPEQYMTPDGWRPFVHHREVLYVKGEPEVVLDVRDTRWGPVLDQDYKAVTRVAHWVAGDPGATNLELGEMDTAEDVRGAMAVANRAGMPEQNFMTADADGHIAWTIAGHIPLRAKYDPQTPAYWDTVGTGWNGWLAPEQYPRIVDPADGRLWSANARVVDGAMLAVIGDGGYDLGARASQIRDDLRRGDRFTPADLLAIQLDDHAKFLARWHSLLLHLLSPANVARHPERAEFQRLLEQWNGRATVDSVAYRLVRGFRAQVEDAALGPLFAACHATDPRFDFHAFSQLEGPLWALVSQQPANLLDPKYRDWDTLLLAALDAEVKELWQPEAGLRARTWGDRNTVRIRHPLSSAVPFLSRFLDMAPLPLPGDSNMPRVQGVGFGASERMVVEPGYEENGILEMPTGQSGWPLSPYYRDSEPFWEQGAVTPFLPGATEHMLTLKPRD